MSKTTGIDELIKVMNQLLGPGGCPWDREQTHQSLVKYLIEETYEVIEAINQGDMHKLKEELGDLLLQVVFHAALSEREGYFNFNQVAETVTRKMINRHPHVFANMDLKTSSEVLENWEDFKKKEGKKNLLEGVPISLPALMRAHKLQEKAARIGFDWPEASGAVDKLNEEIHELLQATTEAEIKEETGDILFSMVNIARMKGIDPEAALQACNDKFTRRFNYIEEKVKAMELEFSNLSLQQLDAMWEEAKNRGL